MTQLMASIPPGILVVEARVGLKRVQHLRKVASSIVYLRNFFAGEETRDRDMLTEPLFRGLTSVGGIQYFIRQLDLDVVRSDAGWSVLPTRWNAIRVWQWLSAQTSNDMHRVTCALEKPIEEIEQAIIDAQA
jgi:hypothetical protein